MKIGFAPSNPLLAMLASFDDTKFVKIQQKIGFVPSNPLLAASFDDIKLKSGLIRLKVPLASPVKLYLRVTYLSIRGIHTCEDQLPPSAQWADFQV